MILRNRDRFWDLIAVGDNGGSTERLPDEGVQERKANGFFFEKEGRTFGLGVDRGVVWLFLDGELRAAHNRLLVSVEDAKGLRTFTAFDGPDLIFSVTYSPEGSYWNLFAMDDEDVDGFTWMRNVLSSPERMAVFTAVNG